MDYKKIKTDSIAVTRNIEDFTRGTGNLYETVSILSKRANQISLEMKEELNQKISEFASTTDNLEEVFENREQIEIAKYYEHLPKPSLISVHEFLNDEVYFRNPHKEKPDEF
ncbi:MAG TPA: DNA-directed RNA polymerase subunit omega [Bacteroidales bacterium]|nr:DNA-directed RNA polymerase subunit omega [Bacteroidales bacterium]